MATPPPSYVCNVCDAEGLHWRVNCPIIRSDGPQHLFGAERAKKYGRGQRKKASSEEGELGAVCVAVEEPSAEDVAQRVWDFDELNAFPMRASTLQQNVLVADLTVPLQQRVWAFVRRRCMPANPEVVHALALCAAEHPTALRVKELIESVEAYAVAEAFISGCASRGLRTTTIADVACGHGLVGLLLAYRFPLTTVVCCDLFIRPAFEALRGAFRRRAAKLDRWAEPLQNLSFAVGALDSEDVRALLGPEACVVALHACTEANFAAVQMANECRARWVLMPCCMRNDACAPAGCQLRRCTDATRFALLCGGLAGRYGCELLVEIDRRITNRNIVMCGGSGASVPLRYMLPPACVRTPPHRYPNHYGVASSCTTGLRPTDHETAPSERQPPPSDVCG